MLKRVLIANRGEIALRIIRACRELDIETVAVYSQADESSLAAQLATQSLCIGPAKAADSYLNQDAILSAALASKCDAIHPGYGFLSENPDFADRCVQAELKYIGPSGGVIRKLGSKSAARTLARSAGVPVVPGSDGALKNLRQAKPGRGFLIGKEKTRNAVTPDDKTRLPTGGCPPCASRSLRPAGAGRSAIRFGVKAPVI